MRAQAALEALGSFSHWRTPKAAALEDRLLQVLVDWLQGEGSTAPSWTGSTTRRWTRMRPPSTRSSVSSSGVTGPISVPSPKTTGRV